METFKLVVCKHSDDYMRLCVAETQQKKLNVLTDNVIAGGYTESKVNASLFRHGHPSCQSIGLYMISITSFRYNISLRPFYSIHYRLVQGHCARLRRLLRACRRCMSLPSESLSAQTRAHIPAIAGRHL